MKNKFYLVLALSIFLFSCNNKKGCTDSRAINYDYQANKNDGSCQFSTAIFYVSSPANFPPLSIYIDGTFYGNITSYYPYGPGNCSASGCIEYQFFSGSNIDWEVIDAASNTVTGTLSPNSQTCIKVRVY